MKEFERALRRTLLSHFSYCNSPMQKMTDDGADGSNNPLGNLEGFLGQGDDEYDPEALPNMCA